MLIICKVSTYMNYNFPNLLMQSFCVVSTPKGWDYARVKNEFFSRLDKEINNYSEIKLDAADMVFMFKYIQMIYKFKNKHLTLLVYFRTAGFFPDL